MHFRIICCAMTARKSGTRRSPQCTNNPASPPPPRAGAQTVRAQSMASPVKLEEIQKQYSAAIDNKDMLTWLPVATTKLCSR